MVCGLDLCMHAGSSMAAATGRCSWLRSDGESLCGGYLWPSLHSGVRAGNLKGSGPLCWRLLQQDSTFACVVTPFR